MNGNIETHLANHNRDSTHSYYNHINHILWAADMIETIFNEYKCEHKINQAYGNRIKMAC